MRPTLTPAAHLGARTRIFGRCGGSARFPAGTVTGQDYVARTVDERQRIFLGLRTVIYPAPDLAASRDWFTAVLGVEPYFDQPFYVGFQVAGYELALDPNASPAAGPITYWGVGDAEVALAELLHAGAGPADALTDVGDGIRVATVREPGGNILGIIENPHFALPADPPATSGPGR